MLALLNPGGEVIYPDPGFPSYRAAIELSGATPIAAPLLEDKNFSFDLDFLADRIGEKTKLLVINSPSNPTGGNASTEDLTAIARLAIERNVWVMTDEIYSDLVYDEKQAPSFFSIDEVRDRTILIDGFSKTFAMTGWRLGYAAMPKPLAEKVSLLTMHAVGCTAGFTQMAGITALKRCRENVAAQRATYQKRRDRIVEGLRSLPGVSCTTPQGAFYAFPNVSELGIPSKELAHRLLEEAGVACLPGTDFGNNGEGYLRFSYAASIAQIEEAIDRIRGFISSL
jgi:aspartate/methionine/tyrosine aminotransferase